MKYIPATLGVRVSYGTDGWEMACHVEDLQFGILAGYFPDDFRQPMLAVLGKLAINYLDIDYTFNENRAASSFLMSGDIVVGGIELVYVEFADSAEPANFA